MRARVGEWEEVAGIDLSRQQLLTQFFSAPLSPDRAETLAPELLKLRELNDRVIALGKQELDEVTARLSQLERSKEARAAYMVVR